MINNLIKMLSAQTNSNNLKEFKKFIEENGLNIKDQTNAVQYKYNLDLNIYNNNANSEKYVKTSPNQILKNLGMEQMQEMQTKMYGNTFGSYEIWEEMLDNEELLKTQYDLLAGEWPKEFNEVVLIVDEDTKLSDYTLYSLGLLDPEELTEKYKAIMKGEKVEEIPKQTYTYDELLDLKFKIVLNTDYYVKDGKYWKDMSEDEEYMKKLLEEAEELKVTGIIRKNEESVVAAVTGGIGYKPELKEYVINKVNESEIAKEQKENEKINIFTGLEFSEDQKEFDYNKLSNEEKAYISRLSQAELAELMKTYADNNGATYETNLIKLGVVNEEEPSGINLYPIGFEAKEAIADIIEEYNQKQRDEGKEENVITYSDLVGTMMNSVTAIIDVISYVLIAFVSVSLIVSSIMIGIITYISVLERIKEIGILRSIGASKKDISRVFNAETLIVGLVAGVLGIGITMLICIPANAIIKNLAGVSNIASLPIIGGLILIAISVILTVIAGLIPAKLAAKKDPVEALRTE